jgi:sugar phosphate isomerase/epimerase
MFDDQTRDEMRNPVLTSTESSVPSRVTAQGTARLAVPDQAFTSRVRDLVQKLRQEMALAVVRHACLRNHPAGPDDVRETAEEMARSACNLADLLGELVYLFDIE